MSKLPVSVFIIAVNEGDRIGRTIESVQGWVDEIVVIDSGSTDDTVKVSESLGARVIHHAWPGYGPQKRFGEEQCRNDWVLNLDADEVVSVKLKEEIVALFAGGHPPHAGYRFDIVEMIPGERVPSRFAHIINVIRLYDRRCGRFSNSTVHDTVQMEKGTVGELSNIVEHRSSRSLTHSIEKLNRYSTMQAENMIQRGVKPAFFCLRLLAEFPISFLKAYLLRRYFLKGTYGFINAMNYAFSRFARLAKYWELTRKR